MSPFKRFIKWLLFGFSPTSQLFDALDNIRNSEKKNEFTTGRIDLIGSFFCNHLFGISNRTPSSDFEGETGQGSYIGDDARDLAWRWADHLDANFDSYEIGGELGSFEEDSPLFNNDDHSYHDYLACGFNPANGLPMLDDCIDIQGNLYGTDNNDCLLSLFDDAGFRADDDFSSLNSVDFFDSH